MVRFGLCCLVVFLAVTGCSKNPAPAPIANAGTTTQSAAPSAAPSASAPTFTFDGAGQYRLGAKLSELQAAGVLDNVYSGPDTCDYTRAVGIGPYKDISMAFRPDGTLYVVSNRSTTIPTAAGARIGDTLAQVQSLYGSTGEQLTKDDAVAFLATATSGHGILFGFDPSKKVINMTAGPEASKMKESFLDPMDAC